MYLKRILTYSILSLIALFGFFGNIHIETQDTQTSSIGISYEGNTTYASNDPATGFINTLDITPNTGAPEEKKTSSAATVKLYNDMIGTINIALAVLSAMISPIILFVGWLMSPDWTSGDLFGLRDPMYKLWVTVSNIVYFIYAILLILIALGTMFGQDKFSYKVMLPKLALGILMVPFTWWFVQWTISISSVVTASVMTIPAETIGVNDSAWFTKPSIPSLIIVDNTGTGSKTSKSDCNSLAGLECVSPKDFIKKAGGMYGPLIVYGYSIFKFEKITEIKNGLDVASAALQLVHTSIVSTIMFFIFGLLTFALAAMLLVRAIKLWMYAIFAPLFTFRFVAGSNLMGGDDDSFTIKEFIGLAFVPAIVGLTLSFGLIMVNAVHGPGPTTTSTTSKTCKLDDGKGCVIMNIMGDANNKITRKIENPNTSNAYTNTTFKFGGIEFWFLGKASNQSDDNTTATGAIDAVGGMFGTLIVDVIALVFIWMAFMAAKNVSKAVKMAVQPFEDIGNKVGSLAKSIPKYTPIPGLGMSASGLSKIPSKLESGFETRANEKAADSAIGRLVGLDGRLSKDYAQLKTSAQKTNMSLDELKALQTNVRNIVGTKGTISSEGQQAVADFAEILKKNKKHSLSEEQLKNLIEGGKLTDGGSHIILGDLSMSTHIKDYALVDKLSRADANYSGGAAETKSTASIPYVVNDIKGEKDRMEVNIDNIKIQLDHNGGNISILSQNEKDRLRKIMEGLTEQQFREKFSGIKKEAINSLVTKANEDDRKFQVPPPPPKQP